QPYTSSGSAISERELPPRLRIHCPRYDFRGFAGREPVIMPATEVVKRLLAVRSEVDQACSLLISPSPTALDSCSRLLETASSRLAQLQPHLRQEAGN